MRKVELRIRVKFGYNAAAVKFGAMRYVFITYPYTAPPALWALNSSGGGRRGHPMPGRGFTLSGFFDSA